MIVVVKAMAFLESDPTHRSIEIWEGGHFVARISRTDNVHEDVHSRG
jgi:hypothetical protein